LPPGELCVRLQESNAPEIPATGPALAACEPFLHPPAAVSPIFAEQRIHEADHLEPILCSGTKGCGAFASQAKKFGYFGKQNIRLIPCAIAVRARNCSSVRSLLKWKTVLSEIARCVRKIQRFAAKDTPAPVLGTLDSLVYSESFWRPIVILRGAEERPPTISYTSPVIPFAIERHVSRNHAAKRRVCDTLM